MQAFEFHTTAQNGFIKIPEEYVRKIPGSIKVIVLSQEKARSGKKNHFPDFSIDTTGFVFDREEANER